MRPNATTHIPFQGDAETGGDCEFYGAPKKRIIHHPTRIRAAKAVGDITAEKFGEAV
jgi:hypothetical protein